MLTMNQKMTSDKYTYGIYYLLSKVPLRKTCKEIKMAVSWVIKRI